MRKKTMKLAVISVTAWITILIAVAQQPGTGQSTPQQSSTSGPKAKPSHLPQEKATHPAPSGNAQKKGQKNSVGKGVLTVTTAQPVDFWQEQVAYSGGNTVTTDFLYNTTPTLELSMATGRMITNVLMGNRLLVGFLKRNIHKAIKPTSR